MSFPPSTSESDLFYQQLIQVKDEVIKSKEETIQRITQSKDEIIQSKDETIQKITESKEETILRITQSKDEIIQSKDETIQKITESKEELKLQMEKSAEEIQVELKTKVFELEGKLSLRSVMEEFELMSKPTFITKQSHREAVWTYLLEKNTRKIADKLHLKVPISEVEKAHWTDVAQNLYSKISRKIHKHDFTKVIIVSKDLSADENALSIAICQATPVLFEIR
jgi:hypothetical protein